MDLAHNNGVKVLASIGGWTLSNNFPGIAADSSKRAIFAGECIGLINLFGFDGIDIDWEYPGYAEHNGTPNDGPYFTALLQSIRDSLDALELSSGANYLLTSCFSADPAKMTIIEWSNVDSIIDYFNMMTYDFFGAWDAYSNHNSPLYAPAQGNPSFNLNATFLNVSQVYGISPSKINLGIAFYGRSVTGCTSLHGTNNGSADNSTFWEDEGSPLYYNILKKMNLFTSYWDSSAQVPYLLGNSLNTFVSYDDKESVAKKAQYVVNNNAGGVIIWEMTGDYIETTPGSGIISGTPLCDTLNYVLCGTLTSDEELVKAIPQIVVSPNPAMRGKSVTIASSIEPSRFSRLNVYSTSGSVIHSEMINSSDKSINFLNLRVENPGVYIIELSGRNVRVQQKLIVL